MSKGKKKAVGKLKKRQQVGLWDAFVDSDRDGVPNILDCAPYNPKRQDVLDIFAPIATKNQFLKRGRRVYQLWFITKSKKRMNEIKRVHKGIIIKKRRDVFYIYAIF